MPGDLQPYSPHTQRGLTQTLAATTGADTVRYLHGPRGILAQMTTQWSRPPAIYGQGVYGQSIYGDAVGSVVSGGTAHHLTDGLGSVRALTDATAALLGTVDYQPFGTVERGSVPTDFGYTGEYTDPTGMLYLRARYYDPATGTFPSLDPFEGMPGRPMSLNGYSYVEGDPVNMIDPSGLSVVKLWAAAFIEPKKLIFPFPDEDQILASWGGDGRDWVESSDLDRMSFGSSKPSSRVWWYMEFDTSNISNAITSERTSETHVDFYIIPPGYPGYGPPVGEIWDSITEKAPDPAPASVQCKGDDTVIKINALATNPVQEGSPPIEIDYSVRLQPPGRILATSTVDNYPWHELFMTIDGVSALNIRVSPAPRGNFGLGPALLFLPAVFRQHDRPFLASRISPCKSSLSETPVPPIGC